VNRNSQKAMSTFEWEKQTVTKTYIRRVLNMSAGQYFGSTKGEIQLLSQGALKADTQTQLIMIDNIQLLNLFTKHQLNALMKTCISCEDDSKVICK
jgi:hypothetical protein